MPIFNENAARRLESQKETWQKHRQKTLSLLDEFNEDIYEGSGTVFEIQKQVGAGLYVVLVDGHSHPLSHTILHRLLCEVTDDAVYFDLNLILTDSSSGKEDADRSIFFNRFRWSTDGMATSMFLKAAGVASPDANHWKKI